MNKISSIFFLISFLFISNAYAQNQGCNPSAFLDPPPQGTIASNTGTSCGFTDPGTGMYINQCSPCGRKISDDDCSSTPNNSLCDLNGFQSTTGAYTEDLQFAPDGSGLAIGFCNGAGTIENNFWVGFLAQTNELCIEVCIGSCSQDRGIQAAIVETNCIDEFATVEGSNPCDFSGIGAGQCRTLDVNSLIPGSEYYIMIDGFAGDICDLQLNVLCGFAEPEIQILPTIDAVLCPDILNPGEFTSQFGSGAIVDVTVSGSATADLTFLWVSPSGDLLASTSPSAILGNIVRGELDATFFTEIGTYSVQVLDNGSCCPACATFPIEVAMPPAAAAAIVAGVSSNGGLDCSNNTVTLRGDPEDGSVPAIEQWQIVNATGDRVQFLDPVLVSNSGRINEIVITRADIETFLAGQDVGIATFVYGFLGDLQQLCFGDAVVEVPFDFRAFNIDIASPEVLGCQGNQTVELIASSSNGNGATYTWTFQDGTTNGIVSGGDTAIATVSNPGTYTVVVSVGGGECVASAQVEVVSDMDIPSAAILTPDVLNCVNQSVALDASNSTAGANLTYQWNDASGNLVGTGTIINVSQPGLYILTLTNENNDCSTTALVVVLADFTEPQNVTATGGVIGCDNINGVQLMANSTTNGVTYLWISDNGIQIPEQNPIVNIPGIYTLIVTNPDNGCVATRSVEVSSSTGGGTTITILPPAVLNCNNAANGVVLEASISNGTGLSFLWTDQNGVNLGTDATIIVTQPGIYTLMVNDITSGCTSTSMVEVVADFIEPQNVTATGGILTCDNSSDIQLFGNSTSPNVSYLWVSDGGIQFPEQNPIVNASGTYTLTVTNEDNACTATETTTVTDDFDVPTILFEQTSGDVGPINCVNSTIEFLGFVDGSNPDPNIVLTWFDPNDDMIPSNPIVLDQNSIEGTYTIVGFNPANNCSGQSSVTILIDLTQPDFTLEGGTIFCSPNETVTLSATDNNPMSTSFFEWTAPNGASLGPVSNPAVDAPGIYTLVATSVESGCSATGAAEVFVNNDAPVVSTAGVFTLNCMPGGDSYDLDGSATTINGMDELAFMWTLNGDLISTDPNPNVSEAGTYILTVTNTVSNCVATDSVLLGDIRAVFTLEFDITPAQEFELIVSGGTAPYTYLWNDGTTTAAIENPISGFAYEVTVTDANGCSDTASEIFQTTATQDTELQDISVYPNPSTGLFNVSYDTDLQLLDITVYDIHGRKLYAQSYRDQRTFVTLDLSDFNQGAYILEVQFEEGVFRDKILLFQE